MKSPTTSTLPAAWRKEQQVMFNQQKQTPHSSKPCQVSYVVCDVMWFVNKCISLRFMSYVTARVPSRNPSNNIRMLYREAKKANGRTTFSRVTNHGLTDTLISTVASRGEQYAVVGGPTVAYPP
jgi:hypothetical protein